MAAKVDIIDTLTRKVTFTLPSEKIEVETQKRLEELATKVKLKGFRPGKGLSEVTRRYGSDVRKEVIQDMVREQFGETIQEEDLRPAGMPEFTEPSIVMEGPVEIEATFEVYPEFELNPVDKVELTRQTTAPSDEDITNTIDKMRQQHAEWVNVDRAAKTGDQVNIDFLGKLNGEPFEGGEAKGFDLEIGSKSMIPGFEEGVEGMKPGETRTIDVTFPENYHHDKLAGAKAQFDITVNTVSESKLPEMDEAFFKKMNVEGGIDKLRENVREQIEQEIQRRSDTEIKNALVDELLKLHEFQVPAALIDSEIERMQQQFAQQFGQQMDQLPELPREHFEEQAERNVRVGLIFSKVVEVHKLEPEEERIDAKLKEMVGSYENPEQIMSYYKSNKEAMDFLRSTALEEQIIEKFLDDVKVVEESIDFDTFMNPKQDDE